MLPSKALMEEDYQKLCLSRAWRKIANAVICDNSPRPMPPKHISLKDLETILNILHPWEIDRLD